MKKKNITDSLIIGAALFSTLFGAGNMIFPPHLGLESGTDWFLGFTGFYIADVGLAILALISIVNQGSFKALASPIGNKARLLLTFVIVLCLGPLISVPRTCATTFELAILPLSDRIPSALFSAVFFIITLLLAFNETKVIDIVGKILTPVLVIGLLFLVTKAALFPISDQIKEKAILSPLSSGLSAGYQSMDILGMAVIDTLLIESASRRGHSSKRAKRAVISGACGFAAVGLFVIYLGLTYMGATASSLYDVSIPRTELLTNAVSIIVPGTFGVTVFGIIAGLACLTTSVSLTGAAAKYFSGLTKGKISYKVFVTAICIFSAVLSVMGVEKIVALASPVLTVIYPPVLVIVLLGFLGKYLTPLSWRLSVGGALVYGIAEAISGFGIRVAFLKYLPLSHMGFGWLLPCALLALIGTKGAFSRSKQK
ncbi:MAG: branched-chain amino acid transport system II carrier protein [Ruminococcaceae bacterium]|nr:branched-chain amino acid transport system II carrier protein [Oscillospiraceae bacterium]